jgi:hypothetical protein
MMPIGIIVEFVFCASVLLVGIVIYTPNSPELGIALISIGGTGLISAVFRFFPRIEFIRNKLVPRAYKRFKEYAKRTRTRQSLSLLMTKTNHEGHPAIEITGVHKYSIKNYSSLMKLNYALRIYTDIGRKGQQNTGGFKHVEIGQESFEGESLRQKLSYDRDTTKETFKHPVTIGKGDTENFVYHIYGIYQLHDRLVWAIEDLSDSFTLKVENKTGIDGKILFSFQHHDRATIIENIEWNKESTFCKIEFPSVNLPYEGFEMVWEFVESERSMLKNENNELNN